MATEEGQAGHIFGGVEFMLREGPIAGTPLLDVGLTRIILPGAGEIRPVTARASSKEGGKETFAALDEGHLYTTPELHRLHDTVKRNLRKRLLAEGWMLKTTTAFAPGEDSVAERDYSRAAKIAADEEPATKSFYFDHRGAPPSTVGAKRKISDLSDDELLEALAVAYGPDASTHVDFAGLLEDARDPNTVPEDWARFFLNIPQAARAQAFIDVETWDTLDDGDPVAERRVVGLGMDGSRTGDTTVVGHASWARDGRLDVGARVFAASADVVAAHVVHDGTIDYEDVEAEILDGFTRWKVAGAAYDPRYFERSTDILKRRIPQKIEAVDPQSKDHREALAALYGFASEGVLRHAGDPVIRAHVEAVIGDFDADYGWKVRKKKQTARIDAVIAIALAIFALLRHAGTGAESVYESRGLRTL